MRRQVVKPVFAFAFVAVIVAVNVWQWNRPPKKIAVPPQPVAPVAAAPASVAPSVSIKPVETVPPVTTSATIAVPPRAPDTPLDLHLPPQRLASSTVSVQEKRVLLPNLFAVPKVESGVKVGGRVILDDNSAEKDATLRERLKGAEVRVDVKTN